MHFSGRYGHIPISAEGFWCRKRFVADVERRETQQDVSAENDDGERYRNHRFHSQGDGQRGHKGLVGGRIEDGPENRRHLEPAGNPTINRVCEASIHKESCCNREVVVDDGIADSGACEDARRGQDIWNGVNVLSELLKPKLLVVRGACR